MRLERLENRNLLAAGLLGATPLDTGEFALGTVAVTPVFFASNGQLDTDTQDWSPEVNDQGLDEIDQVMQKIDQGLDWWTDTLATLTDKHSLTFEVDPTFVDDPFPTRFEPIDRNGSEFPKYVTEFIIAQGYGDATSIEDGVRRFNHDQRIAQGTDWAFTIFVVDASDDQDDQFAPGEGHRGAFAFAGGLFMVVPSTRSAAIFAHELGHIFWAMDEYPFGASWTDRRGYYDGQLLNAADNPAFDEPGVSQEISIMRGFSPLDAAFAANVSPASTLALVGWQDSDGDGVFDLADVPLDLDATGYFDAQISEYRFYGSASAVPLLNRNSSGPQSDITPNRVSEIQYRIDDGDWITAATPDQPVVEFDLTIPISDSFDTIQWRAIDSPTGVTSEVIAGSAAAPALSAAGIAGVAFVDTNNDGMRDLDESVLANTTVRLISDDGSELFRGNVNAENYEDGLVPDTLTGVVLRVNDDGLDNIAGAFFSAPAENRRVLFHYDTEELAWSEAWSADAVLNATFDDLVGQVSIDVIGLGNGQFGRLEAFDSDGNLIDRATSDSLADGQLQTITVSDPSGRIASIRARGHAGTQVALNHLVFGINDTVVTDQSGAWRFENLADGQYQIQLVPERVIHELATPTVDVDVVGGASELVWSPAARVDSTRHNSALAEDANGIDGVTSLDALVIINDLGRNSVRILQPGEEDGFHVDVNNDGMVSALDALLVINYLGRGESEGQQEIVEDPAISIMLGPMGNYDGHDRGIESSRWPDADRNDDRVGQWFAANFVADSHQGSVPSGRISPRQSSDQGIDRENRNQPVASAWSLKASIQAEIQEPITGYEV